VTNFFPFEDTLKVSFRGSDPDGNLTNAMLVMEQAHQRALAELPAAKKRYQSGALANAQFGVKHGFPVNGPESGDQEYMWVFVQSWNGNHIVGVLVNEPHSRLDLKLGQTIELTDSDIYDWLIMHPGGSQEGGYTNILVDDTQEPQGYSPDFPKLAEHMADPAFRQQAASSARQTMTAELKIFKDGIPKAIKLAYRWPVILFVISSLLCFKIDWLGFIGLVVSFAWAFKAWKYVARLRKLPYNSEQLVNRGEFTVAYIVMANAALFQPGISNAPCLALYCPDERPDDIGFLMDLTETMMALKGKSPIDGELRTAAGYLNDERYMANRRRRIPMSLTGGRRVYAVDLVIDRANLPNGYLQIPAVACLATPGETGVIRTIPWPDVPEDN
jgi:uncharacterized protein YegJ (DUF2314 family)